MGYERKRGKLGALNALLRGGPPDAFSLMVGDTAKLTNVKYVITLDTDTQLPRDAARQLVGAMAHPLNRARYCEAVERVCEGYGILQPRVGASLPGSTQSRYARLFGSEPGIDPYTRAVSDVYQDLFGEGSFIGKGIYDVDAFERALKGRFPDNRILSHDLVEGCYARSGLLTDVQVYEEYPARYSADVSRRHRWIRGDWQLLRWLLPWVPGAAGRRGNAIGALSRWKLFDNLRRSVVPVALTLLFLLTWALLPLPGFWTLAIIGIVLIPGDVLVLAGPCAKTHGSAVGTAPDLEPALCLHAPLAGRLYAGVPALRGILQPGRDPAHALADAGGATPAARMERVQRGRPQSRKQPGGILADDVDRPGAGACRPGLSHGLAAKRIAGGLADLGTLGHVPEHRLVDQPARAAPRVAFDGRTDRLPAQARAQDLGLL